MRVIINVLGTIIALTLLVLILAVSADPHYSDMARRFFAQSVNSSQTAIR